MFVFSRIRARAQGGGDAVHPSDGQASSISSGRPTRLRAVVSWVAALAMAATFTMTGGQALQAAAANGDDGLYVSVTPDSVASGQPFTLNVTDSNTSGASFDSYYLYGLPAAWVVKDGGSTVSPTSPDPVIYQLPKGDVQSGRITITPPSSYTGTLTGVSLARVSQSKNLITAFDNGTFDYIDGSKYTGNYDLTRPNLNTGETVTGSNPTYQNHTDYAYHDPTVLYDNHGSGWYQYGPVDGDYTIWPTADINGPTDPRGHFNNKWADLRSSTHPLATSTQTVCANWDATPTYKVPDSDVRVSGKIAVFNGALSRLMPVPNDLIRLTVGSLQANHYYMLGADVANISDDRNQTVPVRVNMQVKQSQTDPGVLIGSSQPLPKQASCYNNQTKWEHMSGIVTTGSSTQLMLSLRNYEGGGFGDDLAIDNLTLYGMAEVDLTLPVGPQAPKNPGLQIAKSADPVSGSTVQNGQTITYTVKATNTGDVTLPNVTVTDKLAGVLGNAQFVANSQTTSTGSAPTYNAADQTLTWYGALPVGQSVTLTYKVTVNQNAPAESVLRNAVTGSASYSGGTVPSNCATGLETGCWTQHVTPKAAAPALRVVKTSSPPTGSTVDAGSTITYTVQATNTGDVNFTSTDLRDDLSKVLANATIVGTQTATINGATVTAPTHNNQTLMWNGPLAVGQTVILTYQVKVNDTAPGGTELLNAVTMTGTNNSTTTNSNCVTGTEDGCYSRILVTTTTGWHIVKTSNPPSGSTVNPGDEVTYTVTATNTGNTARTNAALRDNLADVLNNATMVPDSVSLTVAGIRQAVAPTVAGNALAWTGNVPAGASVVMSYTVKVNDTVPPNTVLRNVVTAPGSNCVEGVDAECTTTHEVDVPSLHVAKTSVPANGSTVQPGGTVVYSVKATNTGDVDLESVTLTDDLSNVLSHAQINTGSLAASIGGTAVTAPTLRTGTTMMWTGPLAKNQTVTLTYSVTVNSDVLVTDTLKNGVIGTGETPGGHGVPSNCMTGTEEGCYTIVTPGTTTGWHQVKTSDPASGTDVQAGDVVTYKVTATNTGNSVRQGANITDNLSGVLNSATLVPGSVSVTLNGTAVTPAPTVTNNRLSWTGDVPARGVVVMTYQVKVNDDVMPGSVLTNNLENCVPGVDDICTTNHTVDVPSLHVAKTSVPANGSTVQPGGTISYTVNAKNTGQIDLDSATVTDDLSAVLANATIVAGSLHASIPGASAPDPTISDNTLTWSGALAIGQTVTITYQVKVNTNVTPADKLRNAVIGTAKTPRGHGVPSNCVTGTEEGCYTIVTPGATQGWHIVKTSDPASGSTVNEGDQITFHVTATNTGNTTRTGATFTDDLSGVLNNAAMVPGSVAVTLNGVAQTSVPNVINNRIAWTGDVPADGVVVLTYKVQVNDSVPVGTWLRNHVSGPGSNCIEGVEPECSTTHEVHTPGLQVIKSSNPESGKTVAPNGIITYIVTARNSGNMDLSSVTLTDDLSGVLSHAQLDTGSLIALVNNVPANPPTIDGTTMTWTGPLPVGAIVSMSYMVKVNGDVKATDIIKNHVVGSGQTNTGRHVPSNCTTGNEPNCYTELTPVPIPGKWIVEKTSSVPTGTKVFPGDTITYTITGTNTGSAERSVSIVDDMSAMTSFGTLVGQATARIAGSDVIEIVPMQDGKLTWNGPVPGNSSVTITYRVRVNDNIAVGTVLKNTVKSPGSNCEEGVDAECTVIIETEVPKLHVAKTSIPASGSKVAPGGTISYTLTASNTGTADLAATLTDDLTGVLSHGTLVASSLAATINGAPVTAPSMTNATTLTWTGDLLVGQTVTVTYQVKVNSNVLVTDTLRNGVIGSGVPKHRPGTHVPSNCVTGNEPGCYSELTPETTTGWHLVKTSDPASGTTVQANDVITYTVTGTNTGNSNRVESLTDNLAGVLNNATLVNGSVRVTMDGVGIGSPALSGRDTLTWSGSVAPGHSVVLTYQVKVNANVAPGAHLRNVVTGPGSNCIEGVEPECTTYHDTDVPGLSVVKTSDPESGSTVAPGGTVDYTVTVKNTGNTRLDPVTVTDDLTNVLSNATLVTGSPAASAGAAPVVAGASLTWTGAMAPGQTVTLTYSVTVNASAVPGTVVANKVIGKGVNPAHPGTTVPSTCVTGAEDGCHTEVIVRQPGQPRSPSLDVSKTSDPPTGSRVTGGQTVTYTLKVINQGNTDLSDAVVTDNLSQVLNHASFVPGSITTSVTGAAQTVAPATLSGTTLHWSGDLLQNAIVTITYKVVVAKDVTSAVVLRNSVIGSAHDSENPDTPVPTPCVVGDEPDCFSELTGEGQGLSVVKTSDPASGSTVNPGDKINYTITVKNTGDVDLNPVTITDDMSKLLNHAKLVDGSLKTYVGGQPAGDAKMTGSTLTWTGALQAGQSATITYQVVVDSGLTASVVVSNKVTGRATPPDHPNQPVPSSCVTGEEPGCHAEVTVNVPTTTVQSGGNVAGSSGALAALVLALGSVMAAGVALTRGARRKMTNR